MFILVSKPIRISTSQICGYREILSFGEGEKKSSGAFSFFLTWEKYVGRNVPPKRIALQMPLYLEYDKIYLKNWDQNFMAHLCVYFYLNCMQLPARHVICDRLSYKGAFNDVATKHLLTYVQLKCNFICDMICKMILCLQMISLVCMPIKKMWNL